MQTSQTLMMAHASAISVSFQTTMMSQEVVTFRFQVLHLELGHIRVQLM